MIEQALAAILAFLATPSVAIAFLCGLVAVETVGIGVLMGRVRLLTSRLDGLTATPELAADTAATARVIDIRDQHQQALDDLEAVGKENSPRAIALRRRLERDRGRLKPDKAA